MGLEQIGQGTGNEAASAAFSSGPWHGKRRALETQDVNVNLNFSDWLFKT